MNKRSPTEWHTLFEEHIASGLSTAAFCQKQGLCPKYFSLRRKQLRGFALDTAQKPVLAGIKTKTKTKTGAEAFTFVSACIRPDAMERIAIRFDANSYTQICTI